MKKILFALVTFLTLASTSCQNDDRDTRQTNENGFKLSYTIVDPVSVVSTRSSIDVEEGEDRINTFYALFFKNTTGATGDFIEAININNYNTALGTVGELNVEFPEGSQLNNSNEYKVLLCANIGQYAGINSLEELSNVCQGKTEREVVSLLMKISGVEPGSVDEEINNDNRMLMTNLPMSARLVKQANANAVSVDLIRAVSRFDVFLDPLAVPGYELASASIWNAYTVATVWEGNFTEFTEARTERYYGVRIPEEQEQKEIIGSLYAFENYVTNPEQKDKETTCLIIGLKNKNKNNKIEYFRANVNANKEIGHLLKRNNAYKLVIKGVTSEGDENERGAYENKDLLLTIDINGWELDESGLIQIEGEDVLAIPTSKARLFTQGDTREYYVYTIGQGVPSIMSRNLPGHIKATLKLAPGYSEKSNFKTSVLTLEATSGTTENSNETYKIDLGFSSMLAPIVIEQLGGDADYVNLSSYDRIELSSEAGVGSGEIVVTSSAPWRAEIAYGDYFSFNPDSHVAITQGQSTEGFAVYTMENNPLQDTRYCFVKIYLADKPKISRVVVLGQEAWDGKYLTLDPTTLSDIPAIGGSSELITVEASGSWTAVLATEGNNEVGFNGSESLKQISGAGNGTFRITFSSLKEYGVSPTAKLTVKLDASDKERTLTIKQTPLAPTGLLVHTNTYGASTLAISPSVGSDDYLHHFYYGYHLGKNMRNTAFFGPQGKVYMPGVYRFKQGGMTNVDSVGIVNIFQLISSINTTEGPIVKAALANDPKKLVLVSHILSSYMNTNIKTRLGISGYSFTNFTKNGTTPGYVRYFNPDLKDSDNPLVKYLIEKGPFTNGEKLDITKITFLGSQTTTGSSGSGAGSYLTAWPTTFVPLVMVKTSTAATAKEYCVFGIDPVTRLIVLSDPSIFGSSESNHTNYVNMQEDRPENIAFLNNFIAWMTNAALRGVDFVNQD